MAIIDIKKAHISLFDGSLPSALLTSLAANSNITYTVKPHLGTIGKNVSITNVAGNALSVAVSGSDITVTLQSGSKAAITSGNAAPFVLAPAQHLDVAFDAGGTQVFTFAAARAVKTGGAFVGTPVASDTITIAIDGGASQVVTFAGTETTVALVAEAISEQITGGRAVVNAAKVDIQSDKQGTGSHVQVVSGTGTALSQTGISTGTVNGSGDALDISAVTIAEVLTKLAGITNGTATNDGSGHLVLTSAVFGSGSSVHVINTTTATGFGFSNTTVNGAGTGSPVSTATQVVAAIVASAAASALVTAVAAGSGAGVVDVKTKTLVTGGNSIELKLGEGTVSFTEKQNMRYVLNRGLLYGVVKGDQTPIEVKFNAIWEFYLADASDASGPISVMDALKNRGGASGWVTSDVDPCNPYSLDVEVHYIPTCSPTKDEYILLQDFRFEELGDDLKQGVFDISGKCNVIEPTSRRQ